MIDIISMDQFEMPFLFNEPSRLRKVVCRYTISQAKQATALNLINSFHIQRSQFGFQDLLFVTSLYYS